MPSQTTQELIDSTIANYGQGNDIVYNILDDAVGGYGQTTNAVVGGVAAERAAGRARLFGTAEAALGAINEEEFLRQHPEFQKGYDDEIKKGGDPSVWLEGAILDAPYIKPSDIPRAGGIVDTVGAISKQIGVVESEANKAARLAGVADIPAL